MEKIKLKETDKVFIRDGNKKIGCGDVNNDGKLYFIDEINKEAFLLPEKYWQTPLILYHPCGGFNEGLIMVSLLGEIRLQYHHTFYDTAGLWGWIDLDGNEVIPPKYVYAMKFFNGRAIVCKGDWTVDKFGKYWCENEKWGVIDKQGNELMPCAYDEIFVIDDSERYMLCHEGGWENGQNIVFDIDAGKTILKCDFDFDNGYMFNDCYFENGNIIFCKHMPGEEKDYVSVYSTESDEWIYYDELVEEVEFNGETKIVVKKDDQEIIVY